MSIVELNAQKISAMTGYTPEQIAIVKTTVAKGVTDTELAYFLNIARSVNLNPFNKEIWAYKDSKGNLLVFTGRDGFLKRAQESPQWNGMTSFEVYSNDIFEPEITENEVKINHKPNFKNRGTLLGAYAIIRPKGCEFTTFEWASLETYNKGYSVWKSDPVAMIKKCAESHALKKAFGIGILQSEYDYTIVDNVVEPIEKEKTPLENLTTQIIEKLDTYNGDDKEFIRQQCIEAKKNNVFSMDFAKEIAQKLGIE